MYFIYILECDNGAFYTGYTTDIKRRYQEHLSGSAKCKYTRSFPPRRLAACWSIESDLSLILKIEAKIKTLTKAAKINLISRPVTLSSLLIKAGVISSDRNLLFSTGMDKLF